MPTSDSGAPPHSPRKLVLRKIAKEVSFPSTLPSLPPPRSSTPQPSRPPGRAPHAVLPPAAVSSASVAPPPAQVPHWDPPPARPAAASSGAPLPPPGAGSVATPMPSRVSVLPFVASVSPSVRGPVASTGGSQRSILIACGVALAGVLVGAGVLLGTRLDEPPVRATARALPAAAPVPSATTPVSTDRSPSSSSGPSFVATANVNDLPRAPVRRSLPYFVAPVPARPPARKENGPPPASAGDEAATASSAVPAPVAPADKAAAAPADVAPPAAPAAPPAPPDPLLQEMQKAVGDSQKN
jgi:hypothetical protein